MRSPRRRPTRSRHPDSMSRASAIDYLVIGGGFYGCSLALFLRSVSDKIIVVEAGGALMIRAFLLIQARMHTGFHYPRSAMTLVRSMTLHRRFADDFPELIHDDFLTLSAIPRRRSKI